MCKKGLIIVFCSYCGTTIKASTKRCPNCGNVSFFYPLIKFKRTLAIVLIATMLFGGLTLGLVQILSNRVKVEYSDYSTQHEIEMASNNPVLQDAIRASYILSKFYGIKITQIVVMTDLNAVFFYTERILLDSEEESAELFHYAQRLSVAMSREFENFPDLDYRPALAVTVHCPEKGWGIAVAENGHCDQCLYGLTEEILFVD